MDTPQHAKLITQLAKHELKELQHAINHELKRRFRRAGPAKYGTLNKGFTEHELAVFFRCVGNEKARTIFKLMAGLGLRVSEACSLRRADIDLPGRRLWVRSLKGSHPTMFYLHDEVFTALTEYDRCYGFGLYYLFPSAFCLNKGEHISPHWVRKEFRLAVVRAGLDMVYGESEETDPDRVERHLHRLTTHSLRHYFVTTIRQKTGDLLLTQRLARHRDIRNTMRYTYTGQDEIDKALLTVFPKHVP